MQLHVRSTSFFSQRRNGKKKKTGPALIDCHCQHGLSNVQMYIIYIVGYSF